MMTVKLLCGCGQKYAFEVEPLHGRMPRTVSCPACGADGTAAANEIIAQSPPPTGTVKTPAAGGVGGPGETGATAAPHAVRSYAAAAAAHEARVRQESNRKRNHWVLAAGLAGLFAVGGWLGWTFLGPGGKLMARSGDGEPPASQPPQSLPAPAPAPAGRPGLSGNLRQALILHYDFDAEPAGGKIADQSGHGNHGRAVGVQWVADGHRGGAVRFGLTNSYITVPNKDELNPPRLTVAAWIKTSYADNVWRRIFDKCYSKGFALSEGGDQQQWHHKGKLEWETGMGAGGLSQQRLDDGQWHHVAATYDGADARLYLDGWPVGRPVHRVGELRHTDYDLTIGANRSNPNEAFGEVGASFNGMMDDVMMFNCALADDEIQTLFKSQGGVLGEPPAPPTPPVSLAPATGNQNQPSAAERLKKLKDLFDQGLINQEQYDQKKKEIMNSL
jgi:hypothetical protein